MTRLSFNVLSYGLCAWVLILISEPTEAGSCGNPEVQQSRVIGGNDAAKGEDEKMEITKSFHFIKNSASTGPIFPRD
eukprot:gene17963-19760_t